MGHPVLRGTSETQVQLHWVPQVLQDERVLRVTVDRVVLEVLRAFKDPRETSRAVRDPRAILEIVGHPEPREPPEPLDAQAPRR